jgi:hypothetical protein
MEGMRLWPLNGAPVGAGQKKNAILLHIGKTALEICPMIGGAGKRPDTGDKS